MFAIWTFSEVKEISDLFLVLKSPDSKQFAICRLFAIRVHYLVFAICLCAIRIVHV